MKNLRKLVLLFAVGLIVFTPVTGLISPSSGKASAASTIPADNASPEELVKSFIYMRAIALCMLNSSLRDGKTANSVDSGHVDGWEWFANSSTLSPVADVKKTRIGYLDDDHNNYINCSSLSFFATDAYSLWKLGGHTDPRSAACYSGLRSEDSDDSQDDEQCATGSGGDMRRDGNRGESVSAFLKNVNKYYYGGKVKGLPNLDTPEKQYWLASRSFVNLCGDDGDVLQPKPDTGSVSGDHAFRMLNDDGTTYSIYTTGSKSASTEVSVYVKDDLSNEHNNTCQELVDQANANAKAYADYMGKHPEFATANGGIDDGDGTVIGLDDNDCGGFNFSFNPQALAANVAKSTVDWLVCGFVKTMSDAAKGMDSAISSMLCIDETQIFSGSTATCGNGSNDKDTQSGFHNAWNTFRVLALALILIAGLIMIISQALGFEFIDAYTIKKVLPRILIAGILISLSWSLLQFVVSLSNGLGIGLRGLIYQPFINAGVGDVTLGSKEFGVGTIFALGGLAIYGALGLLAFVGTALLAIIVAFLVIILRNILVILLIIIAPIAIAAYVLPNTEKYARTWWDWLFKALMMFPLITGFIAVGHVFAAITSKIGGTFSSFIALAAYVAPYFLIPLTFRLAGGAIATIGGIANDRSRGGFDRLKKFRSGQSERNLHAMKEGNRFRNNNAFTRGFNRTSQAVATAPAAGLNPALMRSRYTSAHAQHTFDQAEEIRTKNADFALGAQDDRILRAVQYGRGRDDIRRRLEAEGMVGADLDTAVGISERMQRSGSRSAVQAAAAMQRFATGTGYNDANGEFDMQAAMDSIRDVSHGDRALAGRLLGQAKGTAAQAGQGAFGGASYGALNRGLEQSMAGQAVDGDAIALDAFMSNDAVTNIRARDPHVRAMTQAVTRRINDIDSGAIIPAQGERGRLVAQLENFQQSASLYAAPQRGALVNNEMQAADRARQNVRGEVATHDRDPLSQVYDPITRQPLHPPSADVDQYKRNKSAGRGDPDDPRLP